MRKILLICISAMLLTACDSHQEFPDTTMKVGHILCTDGQVLPYAHFKESGKEAVGVVVYLNRDSETEGKGYAVYLYDTTAEAFADSIGVNQGTSADVTALDGNANTFALFHTTDASSPLAKSVFDIWSYGQSAYIPSVGQMRLLYGVKAEVNQSIGLCGGDLLPDHPDQCWYWTSTEVKGQQTAKAWLYSVGSGAMQETPKLQAHKARAIITINE